MNKILLVDDERIFHFLTEKIFEVSGVSCEIHSAFDGKDALQKIDEGLSPDFIFVDLDMPNINGFQFIEIYRNKTLQQRSRIIVLSSSISESERQRVMMLGADVYMSKPLTENDVRQLMP